MKKRRKKIKIYIKNLSIPKKGLYLGLFISLILILMTFPFLDKAHTGSNSPYYDFALLPHIPSHIIECYIGWNIPFIRIILGVVVIYMVMMTGNGFQDLSFLFLIS